MRRRRRSSRSSRSRHKTRQLPYCMFISMETVALSVLCVLDWKSSQSDTNVYLLEQKLAVSMRLSCYFANRYRHAVIWSVGEIQRQLHGSFISSTLTHADIYIYIYIYYICIHVCFADLLMCQATCIATIRQQGYGQLTSAKLHAA